MTERSKIEENLRRHAEALAPVLRASGEALAPVLQVLGSQFKQMAEQARRQLDVLVLLLPPRRPAAHKPCAWCTDRVKRPATYIVKWHKTVVWEDDYDQEGAVVQPGGRRQRMCEFHAKLAERYSGVKIYRFRRLA